jgi:hypothetical protein
MQSTLHQKVFHVSLKPIGDHIYHRNFIFTEVYLCFVRLSEQAAIIILLLLLWNAVGRDGLFSLR